MFSWSIPFLAEKITGMLYQILKQCSDSELKGLGGLDDASEMLTQEIENQNEKVKKKLVLRNKI